MIAQPVQMISQVNQIVLRYDKMPPRLGAAHFNRLRPFSQPVKAFRKLTKWFRNLAQWFGEMAKLFRWFAQGCRHLAQLRCWLTQCRRLPAPPAAWF